MTERRESRRVFMGRAALAAAGLPLVRARRPEPSRKPLGVALVGLGGLSANQIAPALQKTSLCRLSGIVTGTPAKAAQWKATFGLPDRSIYDYDTMERMAGNEDIDIACIVTPNALHARHSIAAARAGKHVLCEKPMEVSVEACEAMIAASRAAGRRLAIAYRCRFEPHHQECAKLARERVLGEVRIVDAGFGFRMGNARVWRLDRALAGGGPLMDVGIYCLQAARMVTGEEPVEVSAVSANTDPGKFRDMEESMAFQLLFPGGAIASCTTTYRMGGLNRLSVYADRGSFGLAPAFNYGGNRGWRSDGEPLRFDEIDQFAAQLDDFARCITTGAASRVPGEEGLRDVRIMMAVYEAARTKRSVPLV